MITIWRNYASVRFGGLVDDAKNYFLASSVTPYDQDNPRRELNEFRKRKRLLPRQSCQLLLEARLGENMTQGTFGHVSFEVAAGPVIRLRVLVGAREKRFFSRLS